MPRDGGGKLEKIVSLLIGFGVGMALLRQVHTSPMVSEPDMNMAVGATHPQRGIAAQHARLKLRGLQDRTVDRSGSSGIRGRPTVTVRASEESDRFGEPYRVGTSENVKTIDDVSWWDDIKHNWQMAQPEGGPPTVGLPMSHPDRPYHVGTSKVVATIEDVSWWENIRHNWQGLSQGVVQESPVAAPVPAPVPSPSPAVDPAQAAKMRLQEAIKTAEECVGACTVEWDTVEELSAAVSHQKDTEPDSRTYSKEDMDLLEATREKVAALRQQTSNAKESDPDTLQRLKELEEKIVASAAAPRPDTVVATERRAQLDKALEEALDAAKNCEGDDCAVAWDNVEELSAAAKAESK
eukprot:gnl/TRDRNA2_/TRDRNA2_125824_c0_seq1.p1 gnl/TRDRNA2_/TRDRNA2_125824_c0~~gnl/TRDRNA2_/TRDRNA2_125824_c0_seq1.p1  ORF type:complete len:376 (+),score=73.19 gnl/TRDRNA2_/TRDRNA2_125824_c0_seq1:73-1128(+)